MEQNHQPAVSAPRQGRRACRALAKCLLVLVGSSALAAEDPLAASPSLAESLDAYLRQSCFDQAQWGVAVVESASSTPLFSTNAHRLLKPASNAKLFTGALALDRLGPDYRIRTDLIPLGPLSRRGVLRGDLLVVGHGDFSASPRFAANDPHLAWQPFIDGLARSGVRRIQGAVVADPAGFQGPPHGSGWTRDDLDSWYGAQAGALNAEDNVVDLVFHPGDRPGQPLQFHLVPPTAYLTLDLSESRTGPPDAPATLHVHRSLSSRVVKVSGRLPARGQPVTNSVTIPDPALFFATRLTEELVAHGIPVRRPPMLAATPADRSPDASQADSRLIRPVESPPLRELLRVMMKASQNLYAQLLLLQVGARLESLHPTETTEAAGRRAMSEFLDQAGIARQEVLLDDGAGLSRTGLVTPAAIVALLQYMDHHPSKAPFLESLPVAGIDGTLRRRLKGTVAEGNLRAKTGTLRYVHALSGFVTNRAGMRMTFAAMLNAYDPGPGDPSGREALDAIVLRLAESSVAPEATP